MAETSILVDHLFTLSIQTSEATMLEGAPQGSRMIVYVTGGQFQGKKLSGTVANGGGDWVSSRQDGTVKLDVRLTLHTEDGAAILMTYNGIGTQGESGFQLRTAPLFETGDLRYAWLNDVQAIGIGRPGSGSVSYEVYQVL